MKRITCLLILLALTACSAESAVKIDAKNFPDEVFRNWVKENAAGGADILTDAQAAAVTDMDVSFCEISSLKGIEHFTALSELLCWSNELTELDLSKNTALSALHCNGNELTKLTLPKDLTALYCDQNPIHELDLPSLKELRGLSCRYNGLTALDLSGNPLLLELDCWGNEIKTLDLSKNTALTKLNCLENPIKKLDLSHNKNLSSVSLPFGAEITLPNGDKITMDDFKVTKGKDGKYRLDLSRYAGKIENAGAEPAGPDEVEVKSAEGVFTFSQFDGTINVGYRLGGGETLDIILYVIEEEL